MDNHTVMTAEIRVTENGYLLRAVDKNEALNYEGIRSKAMWTFETLPALMKELPRIMALPLEKQPSDGKKAVK